ELEARRHFNSTTGLVIVGTKPTRLTPVVVGADELFRWLHVRSSGGTTTIERACLVLVRFEEGRPQRRENAHAPPLGCQGFNDAVEIDDERFPALLWSLRVIRDRFSQRQVRVSSAMPPEAAVHGSYVGDRLHADAAI